MRLREWDNSDSGSESSMFSESGSENESESSEDATKCTAQFVVDEILKDRRGPAQHDRIVGALEREFEG
jgi:hypothetical protein